MLSRLSPRERWLLAIAGGIAFVMTAIYLVRLPGEAAARSAADRNSRAAADLIEVRTLAASTGEATLQESATLAELAQKHGLAIIESRSDNGAIVLRLSSGASTNVLAWAAEASQTAAPLRSLSIVRDGAAELSVEAAFAETAS